MSLGAGIALGCALAALVVCAACLLRREKVLRAERRRREEAEAQVRRLSSQASQSEEYYLAQVERIQEIRRMQHDSLHHLRVLSGYVRDGAYDRLREYLETLIARMPAFDGVRPCSNHAANILLDYYAEQARNEGIAFHCDTQIPADVSCTPADLCSVLGNALQNALDACVRMDPGQERYIALLARMVGLHLTLEIKNSFDGIAEEHAGHLLSRKEEPGHGLGLGSILRIAAQYRGYCKVSRTEDTFTLRVVLALGGEP